MDVYLLTLWNIYVLFLVILAVDSKKKTECQLMLKQTKDGQKNLSRTAELLTITFILSNSTHLPHSVVKDTILFQPLQWKRISGTHGKGLLQLKPVYEMLSLSLLSFKTEETRIELLTEPLGCVGNLTELEYEYIFRDFLLNFSKENDEICNEHVGNISGYASFYHECCHYDHHESMKCDRVLKNKWMQAIHYCTYIVMIIVVLYCPLLVPSSLYKRNYGSKKFEHCLEDSIVLIVKTADSTTSSYWTKIRERICKQKDNGTTIVPYARFKGMTNFKKMLKDLDKEDKYEVTVSKIYFRVRDEELLAANEVPNSVFKVLYDLLFKCNIRKQDFVSTCCKASVCGTHWPHGITYPWYKLLRFLLHFILSVAVCLPWIIRVYFFYAYENEIRESRLQAAESRSLLVRIENNLTYYGTPLHVIFIICYAFMCFGYIFLELTSVVLFKNIQCVVRDILTKCFDGMCDRSKQEVFQNCIKFLLKPCKAFGIFGMLLSIPYWICMVPLVFALNAYYFFPTVYIALNFLCLFPHAFRRCFCSSYIPKKKQENSDDEADEKKSIWSNLPFNTTKTYSNMDIGLMFILLCLMLSSLL